MSTRPAERPTLIITGAAGQLGSTLAARLADRWSVVALTRHELDLADDVATFARVRELQPAAICNCAAYTNVDGAEDQAAEALAVNAIGVATLARAADASGAAFVHYSTDFVFKGNQPAVHSEADVPEPQSVYGQSKLVGEWLAADAARHYVLRVESLFGGTKAASSIDRIIANIRSGQEVRAFSDRTVSPSYVVDVADATAHLLASSAASGVYHCVNSGHTTWLDLAGFIARTLGLNASITPVRAADLKLRASRPLFAALDNRKLANAGFTMPTWQDALRRYLGPHAG